MTGSTPEAPALKTKDEALAEAARLLAKAESASDRDPAECARLKGLAEVWLALADSTPAKKPPMAVV